MLIKNTPKGYGLVAILLHWLMAILIIGMLWLGLYMVDLPLNAEKLKFYRWHKEFGFIVLVLAVLRLLWRLGNNIPQLTNLAWWEKGAARIVHLCFYGFMFLLPITGWLLSSAAGFQVSVFGWFLLPNLIPADENLRELFTNIHEWLAYFLIAFIVLHTAAALKHHFINRDNILLRMLWP